MNPNKLADKLVEAIREVVPAPYRVWEEQGMVFIGSPPWASEVADTVDERGDPIAKATVAAREALDLIQNFMTKELGNPWPAAGSRPGVAVTENLIEMWFEDEAGNRVLEVPSIPW